MRDKEQINEFCAELAKCWDNYPEWSFGELMSNFFEMLTIFDINPREYNDEKMLKAIQGYFEIP